MKIRAAVVAFLLGISGVASATEIGQTWTDPSGAFSVTIAEGWVIADREQHPSWFEENYQLVVVEANGTQPENICYLSLAFSAPALGPAPRERMNEGTRALERSSTIDQMRNDPRFRFDRVETPTVDGVTTLDIYAGFESLETVQRRFFLHHSDMISMYILSCSVPRENAQVVAQSRAIAASLRFHLPGSTP